MELFTTSSFVYSGPSTGSVVLQGFISDLVLTVSTCSITSVVEAYYSSFICANLCDSLCTGPGHHSCSKYIQLIDPYTPFNAKTITGDNLIFEGRTDNLKDISVSFWVDSDAFVSTEVVIFNIKQMYYATWNNQISTYDLAYYISMSYEALTGEYHPLMRVEVPTGYYSVFYEVQSDTDHVSIVKEGYVFLGSSICKNQNYMKMCNVVNGKKYCKRVGTNWPDPVWIRYYDNTHPNQILVGTSTPNSKVVDVRFYDSCLTDDEFFAIYDARFTTCEAECIECSDAVTCVKCKDGFYLLAGDCLQCPATCPTCYGPSCDTCAYKKNGNCVGSACQSNEYSFGRDCFDCDSSCLTCKGGTAADCLSCNGGFKLDTTTGNCIPDADCLGGTYYNGAACVACPANCLLCGSGGVCTACKYGFFLNQSLSTCNSGCPGGTWRNGLTRTCEACHAYCQNCQGPAYDDNCFSCNAPSYYSSSAAACALFCYNIVLYPDDTTRSCTSCDLACYLCDGGGPNSCTECEVGLYLHQGSCLNTCPEGYWMDTPNKKCVQCDAACTVCQDATTTQCSSCSSGNFLYSSTCDTTCPIGYVGNSNTNLCDNCNSACAECYGVTLAECTNCALGHFLYQTSCLTSCPIGYWGNTANKICETCHEWCSVCTGPDPMSCTVCKGVALLSVSGHECSLTCDEGYWGNYETNRCDECHKSCSNCSGPGYTDNCKACRNDAVKQPDSSSCLFTCPNGYWADTLTNKCILCNEHCNVCTGPSSTECLVCSPGFFLQDDLRTCISACPEGFVRNTKTSLCDDCTSSCGECTVIDNRSICSSCKSGMLLQPELYCESTCPSGYWDDLELYKCLPCHSSCQKCFGRSSDMCTVCNDGFALQPNTTTCDIGCPDTYWEYKSVCIACEFPCFNCEAALKCEADDCICKSYCEVTNSVTCQSCLDCMAVRCGLCLGATLEALSTSEYSLTINGTLVTLLTENDLALTIGKDKDYFAIDFSSNAYSITTDSKASSDLEITVEFLYPERVVDSQGFGLKVNSVSVNSFSETAAEVIAKQGYQAGAQGAMAAVLLMSLMKMNFSIAWLLMNSMQLISFAPLGMPFLPADLQVFLGSMDSSNALPSIFTYIVTSTDNSKPPTHARTYGKT